MALRLVVIIALVIAALGLGIVAYRGISPSAPAQPRAAAPRKRPVVVLTQAKAAGDILTDGDMRTDLVDPDKLPANALTPPSSRDGGLAGAMVRSPLQAGAVLSVNDVLPPAKRGFLSSALSPGMRAISIAVDAVTGASGLIAPEDRVDLLLTQGSAGDQPAKPAIVSEMVLGNLRVIAVDQRFVDKVDAKDGPGVARTITVEATPDQALRVAVAQQMGRLSLAVRPVEPPAPPITGDGRPIYARDVAQHGEVVAHVAPRPRPTRPKPGSQMTVIQGADVQRITLP